MATTETVTDMKGNVVKMEMDHSETVDNTLPKCEEQVKVRAAILYRYSQTRLVGLEIDGPNERFRIFWLESLYSCLVIYIYFDYRMEILLKL